MLFNSLFLSLDTPLNLKKKFSKPAVSKSNAIIFFPEIKKFEVEHAKAVVEMHGWKIKPGEIHSDNGTVIDWINKHKKIIEESKDI